MSVSAKRATAVDWQLPAEQVARSINAGARARRALETYCAVFRIELHQAEAIETIHNSAPGTLVSIDGKSCTVVAGDRRLVRVTDSTTSFLGGQTPYLKEIVGGAGLKAPIVLGPSRSGAPDDPYWLRARHAWQRVASRLLVLYLGGSPEDALQTVGRSRDSGVDPIVIDLAAEGDLQVRYPWLDGRTPQDYADSPSARQARQRAARWMQEIPHRRLIMSSRSFLGTITDGGTPTWWRMEISLQERAFLSVRLVETVKEIIRIEHVGRATIVGGGGGWVAELLRATCRVAGVAVDEVG